MTPLFSLKNIVKTYRQKRVVNRLSLDVYPGEIVGLLGPNGAGKTTTFYTTMGLIRPDSGQIFFEGAGITTLPIHKRAQLGIGYLAQEPSVFQNMTVEENLICVIETLPLNKIERQNTLIKALDELHLTKLRDKKAHQLSGGERRRLEITRALVTKPKLLLLDEPFANVDPITISEVKNLVRLLKQRGISILITDHNAREIFSIVDRSYLVLAGENLTSGTPQELIHDKKAKEYYLGDSFQFVSLATT